MAANNNAAAFAELDKMIEACRSMPGMAKRYAFEVAGLLEDVVAQAVAEGRSPEGAPWKPTVAGNTPLRGAMSAVSVAVDGDGVTATLSGHHVFHQRGTKSQAANKASRAAGAARRMARSAAKEARRAAKQVSAAEKSLARQIEKRGKATKAATERADFARSASKRMAARSSAESAHAAKMTSAASASAGVGGLPARPIIPQSMPMTLTEATRELFAKRWEEHMAGGGA
jgi:hypothetical protein